MLLDRWFAAYNDHDVDALVELADRDIEVIPVEPAETVPPGTTYHGHAGLRTLMTAGFKRWPRIRINHAAPKPNGNGVTVDLEFLLDDGVAPPKVRTVIGSFKVANGHIRRIRGSDPDQALDPNRHRTRADALSPREREILSMIAGGNTVAEIAEKLYLSPFTVRTHVRNAKDKLQARTTAHAVAIALDDDALDP